MAEQNVQYGGDGPVRRKRVYYGGTTALTKGAVVAYVEDAKTFLPEDNASFNGTNNTGDRALSRGVQVEIPTTASIPFFAGVVSDGDVGKTESWITILVPNRDDVMKVRVEGTTDIAVGDHLGPVNAQQYLTHQAFSAETSKFYALEAFTDDAESVILAKRL